MESNFRESRQREKLRHEEAITSDQTRAPYLDALARYRYVGYTSFATPGHKSGKGAPDEMRKVLGSEVLLVDAARAGGVEDSRESTGLIGVAEHLAAEAYGADHALFLVNGSTSGVHALVLSLAGPGDRLIVPRNSHKSMLAALILSGAMPQYVEPAILGDWRIPLAPNPKQIEQALRECPGAKAVFVTSPSMFGICADCSGMADVAHRAGVPFVVDQAWGPHLRFCPGLPLDAMGAKADACVTSIHKLISGITQASLLLARHDRIDLGRLSSVALMTQSTSPQALIYASIDAARQQMVMHGRELWQNAIGLADWARGEIGKLRGLAVIGEETLCNEPAFELDPTRLTISARELGLSGYELESILRLDYRIVVEMSDPLNVVCNITHGDSTADLHRLVYAMSEISARYCHDSSESTLLGDVRGLELPSFTSQAMSPRDAFFAETVAIPTKDAAGEISAEMVTPYPPGIPVLGPGEKISDEIVSYLVAGARVNIHVHGPHDESLQTLRVVKQ